MNFDDAVLKYDEKVMYGLRGLYRRYGYEGYKIGKFEKYDLYAHNKNFLISENILTFTNTDGALMALKPDVTLSIIKNIRADDTSSHKLYYNENVYRTTENSDGFREIMQTGLECIGTIDTYAVCEVVMLANDSLAAVSDKYVLDISHMGFIVGLLEEAGIDSEHHAQVLKYMEMKNSPAIAEFCRANGVSHLFVEKLIKLSRLYAPLYDGLEQIKMLVSGDKMRQAFDELKQISDGVAGFGKKDKIYLDFSVVNDMDYYNGVIFRGFVDGIPSGILSGGRYDSLMHKMGKRAGAIGFAVYLDRLEVLDTGSETHGVDALLLYDADTDIGMLTDAVNKLTCDGKTVRTAMVGDEGVGNYRRLFRITNGGIELLETND